MTDSYEYDAYGNSFTVSGTTPNEFMYRGEQYDSGLGLYYLRARYYNPATGRFMSRDPNEPRLIDTHENPIDTKALHKYLYAGGDPVNMFDPTGRNEEEDAEIEEDISIPTFEITKKDVCVALLGISAGFGTVAALAAEEHNDEAAFVLGILSLYTATASGYCGFIL